MHASFFLLTCLVFSNPLILSMPTSTKPTEKKVFRAAIALLVDERGFDPQYHKARKAAFLKLHQYFPIGKDTSSVGLFQQIDDSAVPLQQFTDNEDTYTKAIQGWNKDATNTDSQLPKGMGMAKGALVKIQGKFKVMVIFVQGVPQTVSSPAVRESQNIKDAGIYVQVVCIDACSANDGSILAATARSLASDSQEVTNIESGQLDGDTIFKNVMNYTARRMCKDDADTCSFTSENRSKCVQDKYLLWVADGSVTGCNDTSPTTNECDIIKCEQFCDKMWPWEKNQNCKNATDPATAKRTGPMPQPTRILKNCEQKCKVSATSTSTLDLSTTPRVLKNGTKKCKNGTKKCNKCEKICGGPWYTWWYFWVSLVLVLINCWMLYRIWYEWDVPNTIFNFGWWQWLYCKFTKVSWRQYKREHAATRHAATRINEKMQDLGKENQKKNQEKKGKRH